MKVDSTWTSILRRIDVDLMSICGKNILCALRLKSNVSINLCF